MLKSPPTVCPFKEERTLAINLVFDIHQRMPKLGGHAVTFAEMHQPSLQSALSLSTVSESSLLKPLHLTNANSVFTKSTTKLTEVNKQKIVHQTSTVPDRSSHESSDIQGTSNPPIIPIVPEQQSFHHPGSLQSTCNPHGLPIVPKFTSRGPKSTKPLPTKRSKSSDSSSVPPHKVTRIEPSQVVPSVRSSTASSSVRSDAPNVPAPDNSVQHTTRTVPVPNVMQKTSQPNTSSTNTGRASLPVAVNTSSLQQVPTDLPSVDISEDYDFYSTQTATKTPSIPRNPIHGQEIKKVCVIYR